jgi:ABC-type phosphate/phosphonate transport system ATPase subunit
MGRRLSNYVTEGHCVCFATHDLDFALNYATRIIFLDGDGGIINIPRHDITFEQLRSSRIYLPLAERMAERKGLPPLSAQQFLFIIEGIQHECRSIA